MCAHIKLVGAGRIEGVRHAYDGGFARIHLALAHPLQRRLLAFPMMNYSKACICW